MARSELSGSRRRRILWPSGRSWRRPASMSGRRRRRAGPCRLRCWPAPGSARSARRRGDRPGDTRQQRGERDERGCEISRHGGTLPNTWNPPLRDGRNRKMLRIGLKAWHDTNPARAPGDGRGPDGWRIAALRRSRVSAASCLAGLRLRAPPLSCARGCAGSPPPDARWRWAWSGTSPCRGRAPPSWSQRRSRPKAR